MVANIPPAEKFEIFNCSELLFFAISLLKYSFILICISQYVSYSKSDVQNLWHLPLCPPTHIYDQHSTSDWPLSGQRRNARNGTAGKMNGFEIQNWLTNHLLQAPSRRSVLQTQSSLKLHILINYTSSGMGTLGVTEVGGETKCDASRRLHTKVWLLSIAVRRTPRTRLLGRW
jgi:hypothetical protein